MGSHLRQYQRSLWRHRQFLRSYRRSLRRCRHPWADWRLMQRRRSLHDSLNIVKHSKTSWNTWKTLWYIVKREPLVKYHETLLKHCETSWNSYHSMRRSHLSGPSCRSGIFLPGTELLQSPFRTKFSMGSRSRRYRRSLRLNRWFLRSYHHRSLRRCRDPWGDRRSPIRRRRSLRNSVNIIKHSKTSWNTCKSLWYIVNH